MWRSGRRESDPQSRTPKVRAMPLRHARLIDNHRVRAGRFALPRPSSRSPGSEPGVSTVPPRAHVEGRLPNVPRRPSARGPHLLPPLSTATENRTPVTTVKKSRLRPLDDGGLYLLLEAICPPRRECDAALRHTGLQSGTQFEREQQVPSVTSADAVQLSVPDRCLPARPA